MSTRMSAMISADHGVQLEPKVPNAETRAAMQEADEMMRAGDLRDHSLLQSLLIEGEESSPAAPFDYDALIARKRAEDSTSS